MLYFTTLHEVRVILDNNGNQLRLVGTANFKKHFLLDLTSQKNSKHYGGMIIEWGKGG